MTDIAETMSPQSAEALRGAFGATLDRNQRTIHRMIDGIGHEQSLLTLVEGGGHLNWVIGHLGLSRDQLAQRLGGDRQIGADAEKRYDFGSQPSSAEAAEPLGELVKRLDESYAFLKGKLAELTAERLSAAENARTTAQRVDFTLWHEAYHVGQLVLYRRAAGLTSRIG